jgi:hypothetical protein
MKFVFLITCLIFLVFVSSVAAAQVVVQTDIEYGKPVTCLPGLVVTFNGFNTAGSAVFYTEQTPGNWILVRKIGTKWPWKYEGELYYVVPMSNSTIQITN